MTVYTNGILTPSSCNPRGQNFDAGLIELFRVSFIKPQFCTLFTISFLLKPVGTKMTLSGYVSPFKSCKMTNNVVWN